MLTLITPIPLPNELDLGYVGGVMRLNAISDYTHLVKMIEQGAGMEGRSRRGLSHLELLSKISQTDLHSFVTKHTMLPFQRGITSFHADFQNCSEENRNSFTPSAMRNARKGAYFCQKCVKRDQQTFGTSYWHREHQLPGFFWCPEHKLPLCYVRDNSAFLNAPADIPGTSHSTVTYKYMKKIVDNPFINSFLTISLALLNREKPFNFKHVSALLRMRAAELGFRTPLGKRQGPLLSNAVINSFGKNWVSKVLPEVVRQPEFYQKDALDGLTYFSTHPYKTSAYVLALSTLFESPKSALNALIQSDVSLVTISNC